MTCNRRPRCSAAGRLGSEVRPGLAFRRGRRRVRARGDGRGCWCSRSRRPARSALARARCSARRAGASERGTRAGPAAQCQRSRESPIHLRLMSTLEARTRYDAAEVEPRIVDAGSSRACSTPSPRAIRTRTTRSRSRRRTSPARCTWATRSTARSRTRSSAATACAASATKWILGTDHAGIATQKQVEKRLAEEGTSREEIGREAFVERVWEWREQYGGTIIEQFQRLGASLRLRRRALHARRGATSRRS